MAIRFLKDLPKDLDRKISSDFNKLINILIMFIHKFICHWYACSMYGAN